MNLTYLDDYKMYVINPSRYTELAFVFKINTALGDGLNQFILPVASVNDIDVDWGDNTTTKITSVGNYTHPYSVGGIYTIRITGNAQQPVRFNNGGDRLKLIELISFGDINWISTNQSFYGCSNIAGPVPAFPLSITTIGQEAFRGCSNITSVSFMDGITSIGANAFLTCSKIESPIILPNTVTSVSSGAFQSCSKTPSITLSTALTTIPTGMCASCTSLTGTLIIPSAITSIGISAFQNCPLINRVDSYPSTAPTVLTNGLALGGTARPLHIPITNSGYTVAPWTTTSIFSTIIADL
jgi:hypothetical protein